MRRALALTLAPTLVLMLPLAALAGDPSGVWKTEPNDKGRWLEVTIGPCADDAAKFCGLITKARASNGEEGKSEFVGKMMIKGMVADGENFWSGGTIWAPDEDKTYRSKMELKGGTLTVKGCVAGGLICRGQDWKKV